MDKTGRRMEIIEKISDKLNGKTITRSGRVILGEITNVQARDRRKPGQVRRVEIDRGKCIKRATDNIRTDENIKKYKDSATVNSQSALTIIEPNYRGGEPDHPNPKNVKTGLNHTGSSIAQAIQHLGLENQQMVDIKQKILLESKENTHISSMSIQPSMEGRNSTFYTSPLYLNDIYEHLLKLEKKLLLIPNHLEGKKITSKMRQVIVDWLFEVQNHFRLSQETLELTITIMDHCLEVDSAIDQENVQLVCLAALFIAVKYEETFLLELSDLRYVCDYSYEESEILQMEVHVLKTIDFNLSYPSKTLFLALLLTDTKDTYITEKLAKYLIDVSLLDSTMATIEASKIAAACTYVSFCVIRGTVTISLPSICVYSLLGLRETILLLVKKALICRGINKGGIYNKHLKDNNKRSIKDLIQSQMYYQMLTQIISVFKL